MIIVSYWNAKIITNIFCYILKIEFLQKLAITCTIIVISPIVDCFASTDLIMILFVFFRKEAYYSIFTYGLDSGGWRDEKKKWPRGLFFSAGKWWKKERTCEHNALASHRKKRIITYVWAITNAKYHITVYISIEWYYNVVLECHCCWMRRSKKKT